MKLPPRFRISNKDNNSVTYVHDALLSVVDLSATVKMMRKKAVFALAGGQKNFVLYYSDSYLI